jgi:hypothetical protein
VNVKKRVLVICALLALGTVGLVTPQLVSASPPNCEPPATTIETQPPEAPALFAPAGADVCGSAPAAINEPDGVFLCYSKFQVEPGVWSPAQAKELLGQGYYYPVAVKGNVPGGTNLGDYHLVCNAPAATPPGLVVNENGMVLPAALAGDTLGYYPLGA